MLANLNAAGTVDAFQAAVRQNVQQLYQHLTPNELNVIWQNVVQSFPNLASTQGLGNVNLQIWNSLSPNTQNAIIRVYEKNVYDTVYAGASYLTLLGANLRLASKTTKTALALAALTAARLAPAAYDAIMEYYKEKKKEIPLPPLPKANKTHILVPNPTPQPFNEARPYWPNRDLTHTQSTRAVNRGIADAATKAELEKYDADFLKWTLRERAWKESQKYISVPKPVEQVIDPKSTVKVEPERDIPVPPQAIPNAKPVLIDNRDVPNKPPPEPKAQAEPTPVPVIKVNGGNAWMTHVRAYAKAHNKTYFESLKLAKSSYNKKSRK